MGLLLLVACIVVWMFAFRSIFNRLFGKAKSQLVAPAELPVRRQNVGSTWMIDNALGNEGTPNSP